VLACPFGPPCHEHPIDKKQVNILFSQEFLNQQNMMTIIFEYLIHDHNNIPCWMGRATNGSCRPSCRNGTPASCAGPCHTMGWSSGPSTARWLVPCQAQPMALRPVSCLGRAKFHVPHAGPFGPARKYMTTTHRPLTDIGGGYNLEGADFPHNTPRPS
jgi:hypothetical protein